MSSEGIDSVTLTLKYPGQPNREVVLSNQPDTGRHSPRHPIGRPDVHRRLYRLLGKPPQARERITYLDRHGVSIEDLAEQLHVSVANLRTYANTGEAKPGEMI
jgi:DNA-directed RNA polymerase specialized sigma24 family protein